MTKYAVDLWERALEAISAAQALLPISGDGTCSRAYYAAFYAVSALFALEGCSFAKHSAVRVAVHRDLVRAGRWPIELGEAFDALFELRSTADYGGSAHVEGEDAAETINKARSILDAVHEASPEVFSFPKQ